MAQSRRSIRGSFERGKRGAQRLLEENMRPTNYGTAVEFLSAANEVAISGDDGTSERILEGEEAVELLEDQSNGGRDIAGIRYNIPIFDRKSYPFKLEVDIVLDGDYGEEVPNSDPYQNQGLNVRTMEFEGLYIDEQPPWARTFKPK